MLLQHFDWDLTYQVLFLYIYFAQPSHELERLALENAHTLAQRTDIFSCKFFAKISLMLDNPFLVSSLFKLNYNSLCFIQISTKPPEKLFIPFGESTVFVWSHPRCFWPLGKFQRNIKISIKTARVSRLSVFCEIEQQIPITTSFVSWQNFLQECDKRFCPKFTLKLKASQGCFCIIKTARYIFFNDLKSVYVTLINKWSKDCLYNDKNCKFVFAQVRFDSKFLIIIRTNKKLWLTILRKNYLCMRYGN